MKRILVMTLTVLVFFLIGMPSFGQEATKSEMPEAAARRPKPDLRIWMALKKGIEVARVPSLAPGKEPEFAILRLNQEEYKEFQANPKDWVNHYEIFKAKVNKLEPCPAKGEAKAEKDPPMEYWYIMVPHWPASTAVCTSYSASAASTD